MKRLFLITLALVSFYVLFSEDDSYSPDSQLVSEVSPQQESRRLAPKIERSPGNVDPDLQTPPSVLPRKIEMPQKKPRGSHPKWESVVDLPHGLKVVRNIYTVKEDNFVSRMGKVRAKNNGNIFFESPVRPPDASAVAYDEMNGRYFPVSPVLSIANVNESLRDSLLSKGLVEYFYQEDLSVLFIQAGNEKVIDLYRELRTEGLDASLEIIRERHRPK